MAADKPIWKGGERIQKKKEEMYQVYLANQDATLLLEESIEDSIKDLIEESEMHGLDAYREEDLRKFINSPSDMIRFIDESVDPFIESLYRDGVPSENMPRNQIIAKAYIRYLRNRADYRPIIAFIDDLNIHSDDFFAGIDTAALALHWDRPDRVQQILLDDYTQRGVRVDLLMLIINDDRSNEVLYRQAKTYCLYAFLKSDIETENIRVEILRIAIQWLREIDDYDELVWAQTATQLLEGGFTEEELYAIVFDNPQIVTYSPIYCYSPESVVVVWRRLREDRNNADVPIREEDEAFINVLEENGVLDLYQQRMRVWMYLGCRRYRTLPAIQGVSKMLDLVSMEYFKQTNISIVDIYIDWPVTDIESFAKPEDDVPEVLDESLYAETIRYMAKNDNKLIPLSDVFTQIMNKAFFERPDKYDLEIYFDFRMRFVPEGESKNRLKQVYAGIYRYYGKYADSELNFLHFGHIDEEQRILRDLGLVEYVTAILGIEPMPKLKPVVLEIEDDLAVVAYRSRRTVELLAKTVRVIHEITQRRLDAIEDYYYVPQRAAGGLLVNPEWDRYVKFIEKLRRRYFDLVNIYDEEVGLLHIKNMDDTSEILTPAPENRVKYLFEFNDRVKALQPGQHLVDKAVPPTYEIVREEDALVFYSLMDSTFVRFEGSDSVDFIHRVLVPMTKEMEAPPSFEEDLLLFGGSDGAGPADA